MNRKLVYLGRIHFEIFKEFTVYCGKCGAKRLVAPMGELHEHREAEKRLRDGHEEFGWQRIPGLGWCCAECSSRGGKCA